jgi:SPP1 gp7 family putative phage head morphogenesis protein
MQLTSGKEKILRIVRPPKKYERQFAEFCTYMITAITQQYRNETLFALNKGTVEKFVGKAFTDAQEGNYFRIFSRLSKQAQNKIRQRFSNDRIKNEVKDLLTRIGNYNKRGSYDAISAALGIDPAVLMANEALSPSFNALIDAATLWVEQLRDDTLQQFASNSIAMMTQGKSLDDVLQEFDLTASKRKNAAKATARQQVASFNNTSTKIRYQNLGITEAVWTTNIDGRERHSHEVRNGERFKLSEGLYSSVDGKTIFPGEEWGCRCGFRGIIPEE